MAVAPKLNDEAKQKYYEALFAMYASEGWRMLMEDVDVILDSTQTVDGVDTIEQLWHRKGEIHNLHWLKNHQQVAEYAFEAQLAEQEGTEEAEPTGGKATPVGPTGESA